MQRPIFSNLPIVSVAALSLPPLHTWPTPAKRAIMGVCIGLCIVAYAAMAVSLVGLATLVLGLL